MNRHERRAAEAKIRRRGVGTRLDEIDKGAMMIGARSAIPDDIKADIARVVCAIWFPLIAGQACYIRSAIGYRVLTMLGFEPEGKIGGLLFRAGPDPRRDVVAFCGKENHGSMHEGQFLGHIWLSLDGETIDFTGCEWKHMSAPADGLARCNGVARRQRWSGRPKRRSDGRARVSLISAKSGTAHGAANCLRSAAIAGTCSSPPISSYR